jgi:GNAT superfamily N-acetyltransferase
MNRHNLHFRLARPSDAVDLQLYFRRLSKMSRQRRFLAAIDDLPLDAVMRNIGGAGSDLFSVVAFCDIANVPRIVGEAVCAIAPAAEVALSVEDRWQRHSIGRALLETVEIFAARRGARSLFGHIWSTNQPIRRLAAKLGYVIDRAGSDWNCYILRKQLATKPSRNMIGGCSVFEEGLTRRPNCEAEPGIGALTLKIVPHIAASERPFVGPGAQAREMPAEPGLLAEIVVR